MSEIVVFEQSEYVGCSSSWIDVPAFSRPESSFYVVLRIPRSEWQPVKPSTPITPPRFINYVCPRDNVRQAGITPPICDCGKPMQLDVRERVLPESPEVNRPFRELPKGIEILKECPLLLQVRDASGEVYWLDRREPLPRKTAAALLELRGWQHQQILIERVPPWPVRKVSLAAIRSKWPSIAYLQKLCGETRRIPDIIKGLEVRKGVIALHFDAGNSCDYVHFGYLFCAAVSSLPRAHTPWKQTNDRRRWTPPIQPQSDDDVEGGGWTSFVDPNNPYVPDSGQRRTTISTTRYPEESVLRVINRKHVGWSVSMGTAVIRVVAKGWPVLKAATEGGLNRNSVRNNVHIVRREIEEDSE